jgi:hypothetical protein
MLGELVLGREIFEWLKQQDAAITGRVQAAGCPVCKGRLHRGDYDRKPRGGLIAAEGQDFVRRFSLCCAEDGCRKRATPPSLRFLGRRVYLGAVVILAAVVAQALGVAGAIRKATGVPERTTRRWLGWWRGPFLDTAVFVAIRARLVGVDVGQVPRSILERLPGSVAEQVGTMLELLAPVTTGSVPDGARFLRDMA